MIIEWTYGAIYQPQSPQWPVFNWSGASAATAVATPAVPNTLILATQYACVQIMSDNSNYHIVGGHEFVFANVINLDIANIDLSSNITVGKLNHIMCDATDGSFSIDLPDCTYMFNTQLRFIRKDEDSTKKVILNPYTGQKINNEDSQELVVGAVYDFTTGGDNWW